MKNKAEEKHDKKVSQIILTFAEPIISVLPEGYTKEEFDAVIKIALTVWNALAIDAWEKNNAHETAVLLATRQMPDEAKLMIKKLFKRKKSKFSSETWAVGDHWLREENEHIIFGCDARGDPSIQANASKN